MPEKKQWTGNDDHGWSPVGQTTPTLPPAAYMVHLSFNGPHLSHVKLLSDKPFVVDDGISEHVFNNIKAFWASKEKYALYGALHKRGILMEGAPGTGKTITCQLLTNEVIKAGGYALITQPYQNINLMEWALKEIREAQPNAPICDVIEDINEHDDDMSRILAILDGENQIGNIVHIDTTNYIAQLDARLTNRPCRFDEVIHIGPPSATARESYITQLIPETERRDDLIKALVAKSEGLMIAHLRELVIAVCVLGRPVQEVVNRLNGMDKKAKEAEAANEDSEVQVVAARIQRRKKKPTAPAGQMGHA